MSYYYLAPHVHACIADSHIVILDAKRDKYLCLPPEFTPRLSGLVRERKCPAPPNGPAGPELPTKEMIDALLQEELISAETGSSPDLPEPTYTPPGSDLTLARFGPGPKVKLSHVLQFAWAWGSALFGTRILGFSRMTDGLRNFKKQRAFAIAEPQPEKVSELIEIFRHLRGFVYTARDHCYFDCAVLMFFLLRNGVSAEWIFGVRMEPYRAHCWVQSGSILLTDALLHVRKFTPLMRI